jgi:hypothetical protein
MTSFQTLKQLIDYIPNCILCGKEMPIVIEGYVNGWAKSGASWQRQFVRAKTELRDDILFSKNRNVDLSIDVNNNHILKGQELIDSLIGNKINVNKGCTTCHFKILCASTSTLVKTKGVFPYIDLLSEEIHYTLKGGKDIAITKYYNSQTTLRGEHANIRLNGKFLPPMLWDFSKFDSIEHMNKRVATIVMFH